MMECLFTVSEKLVASSVRTNSADADLTTIDANNKKKKKMKLQKQILEAIVIQLSEDPLLDARRKYK